MSHGTTGNKRDREAKRDRRKQDKADRLQRSRDEAAKQRTDGEPGDGVEAGAQPLPDVNLADGVIAAPDGAASEPATVAKLYVGGLDEDMTAAELKVAFSNFGKVTEAEIVRERSSGRPRGFGYVTFENWADAEEAIKRMHGLELGGRPLKVNRAEPTSR